MEGEQGRGRLCRHSEIAARQLLLVLSRMICFGFFALVGESNYTIESFLPS